MQPTTKEGELSVQRIQHIQQEVDLLTYIYAIADAKWLIIFVGMLFAGATYMHAKTLPDVYLSAARADIREISDHGGVKPDSRRTQEAIGMLEHGFVVNTIKDNYTDLVLLRMKSSTFIRYFMDKHNIYQYQYPQHWDKNQQQWHPEFELDRGFAQKEFLATMLQIGHDSVTDLVGVRIIYTDPHIAAKLANLFVDEFNEFMRNETLSKTKKKITFIEKNLNHTQVIEIQRMLFRLMEAQTAVAMLAKARKDYILEVLDPATPPFNPHSPNRKQMVILGFMAGMLVCTSGVLFWQLLLRLNSSLKAYQYISPRKPVQQRYWGIRAWLYKCYRLLRWLYKRRPRKRQ